VVAGARRVLAAWRAGAGRFARKTTSERTSPSSKRRGPVKSLGSRIPKVSAQSFGQAWCDHQVRGCLAAPARPRTLRRGRGFRRVIEAFPPSPGDCASSKMAAPRLSHGTPQRAGSSTWIHTPRRPPDQRSGEPANPSPSKRPTSRSAGARARGACRRCVGPAMASQRGVPAEQELPGALSRSNLPRSHCRRSCRRRYCRREATDGPPRDAGSGPGAITGCAAVVPTAARPGSEVSPGPLSACQTARRWLT
jgi:hypothetical protein